MNEPTPNSNLKLNDDHMDQLLSAFYKMELPEQLGNLPSSWPEVTQQSAEQNSQAPQLIAAATTAESHRPAGSRTGRGIVVAVATLAACLLIMAISSVDTSAPTSSGFATSVEPQDRNGADAMINVSEEGNQGQATIIDDTGLSLEELDSIQLQQTSDQELPVEPVPQKRVGVDAN